MTIGSTPNDHPATPLTPATQTTEPTQVAAAKPDFPFYNDQPTAVSGWRWLAVIGGVVAGAAADLFVLVPGPTWLGVLVRAILFAGIPLTIYALAVPNHWNVIFRLVGLRDVGLMIGIAVANVVATFGVGLLVSSALHLSANPMGGAIRSLSLGDRLLTFAAMVPQLFGEEIFTILPLLAILWLAVNKLHLPRWAGITIAWIGSAVIFALLHLPTYNWNLLQCLVVIGTARLILSLAYLLTKNIWVSTGAHVLNDWTLFGLGLLGTS